MLQVPAVPVWWWHSSGGLFGALAVCALAPPGESSKLGSLTGLRHRASPLVCSSLLLASEHPHAPLSPPWLLVGHTTSSAVCPAVGLPGPQKQAFPSTPHWCLFPVPQSSCAIHDHSVFQFWTLSHTHWHFTHVVKKTVFPKASS